MAGKEYYKKDMVQTLSRKEKKDKNDAKKTTQEGSKKEKKKHKKKVDQDQVSITSFIRNPSITAPTPSKSAGVNRGIEWEDNSLHSSTPLKDGEQKAAKPRAKMIGNQQNKKSSICSDKKTLSDTQSENN